MTAEERQKMHDLEEENARLKSNLEQRDVFIRRTMASFLSDEVLEEVLEARQALETLAGEIRFFCREARLNRINRRRLSDDGQLIALRPGKAHGGVVVVREADTRGDGKADMDQLLNAGGLVICGAGIICKKVVLQ